MSPEQALIWKRRFALMYAMGSWTLLGSIIYYTYWGKEPPPGEERTPPREKPADAFFTSTIGYNQNVQSTTGLYDGEESFFATSDGPGPEE